MYVATCISCVNALAYTMPTISCSCGENCDIASGDRVKALIWSGVNCAANSREPRMRLLNTMTPTESPILPPSDLICVSAPWVTAENVSACS